MPPWLPCGPPSVEAPPARCTPRWATLPFPSSLVCQAQAPFHLLKCGPRGCRDTQCRAAGLPADLASLERSREAGEGSAGESWGEGSRTPGLGSSLVALAWLRPAGGQHVWGRPHREQELWVLVLVGRHPGGLSPSLGTVPPVACWNRLARAIFSHRNFARPLLETAGSLKWATEEVFTPWKLAYATVRVVLQGPPCQYNMVPVFSGVPSRATQQLGPLCALGSISPSTCRAPASGRPSVPARTSVSAISCLSKLSGLGYGGASSSWHGRQPVGPHQAGRSCSHWQVTCPPIGSASVSPLSLMGISSH